MSGFASSLYEGRVTHTRLRPFRHHFEYRLYYALFDIDEMPQLDGRLRLFSNERRNLVSFRARDHGPGDGSPLRPWVEGVLADAGVDLAGGPIRLLAFPRVVGYVFNPISVWYCYRHTGELAAVMHEVRNTFGDKHVYVVPLTGMSLEHTFAKQLHVSPFMDMESTYRFSINRPGKYLTVAIEQEDGDGPLLRAGLSATRLELSDRNLLRLFLTHPLVTLKAISAIHWQALLLWKKGAAYRKRPEPRVPNVTVVVGQGVAP